MSAIIVCWFFTLGLFLLLFIVLSGVFVSICGSFDFNVVVGLKVIFGYFLSII